MGSTTHRGRGITDPWQARGRMGLERWGRHCRSLVVGMVVGLIRVWHHLRDEPCRWCWKAAPFLVPGVLFALRHQIGALLGF